MRKKKAACCLFIAFYLFNQVFAQTLLHESFDDTTFVPAGWYKAKIFPTASPASGQWDRVTAGTSPVVIPHSGAGMARFNSPTAGFRANSVLGTSVLDLSSGKAHRVKFWIYKKDDFPYSLEFLDIYINTQQNITGGHKLGSIYITRTSNPSETANGWFEYTLDLPPSFNTATNYIIFSATGLSRNAVYLDDVTVETSACGKPTGITATSVLSTSATFNWNAPVSNTPAGYDWELRTDGSPGTGAIGLELSGTTGAQQTSVSLPGLVTGIGHTFYVRSSCGTDKSTWSSPIHFSTPCSPATIPYTENFDGTSAGLPVCTYVENISGGFSWASTTNGRSAPNAAICTNGGWGSDSTKNSWFYTTALALEAGKCYQLSFAYHTNYGTTTSLKINLGQAQTATAMTAGEIYNNTAIDNEPYKVANAEFSVSATGAYFIGFNYNGVQSSGYLYIDDISVKESLGAPTAVVAANAGTTSAQLNWSLPSCGATPSSYEWELRTTGSAGSGTYGLASTGIGSGLTNTFTGLIENIVYTFYVRSKAVTETSLWSTGVNFQTSCGIRNLPYIQNFDSVGYLPTCFIRQDLNTVYNYQFNTWQIVWYDSPNSLPNCLRIGTNVSNYSANNWLFTPAFTFIAGKSYRLRFYYRSGNNIHSQKLEVKYGIGANAEAMTSAPIFSNINIRNQLFKEAVIDFVPRQNGTYNIGFRYFSDALGNFVYLDDVKVEETPVCDIVREVTPTNITASTASVKWQSPLTSTPEGYEWELRTGGNPASGVVGLVASGSLAGGALTVPLTGLTTSTTYKFYISSKCSGLNSEWVSRAFTTACNATYVPYSENFDGVTAPALPPCTKIEEQFDYYTWYLTTGLAKSGPNSLVHSYTYASPFDDWFFTAPLQLTAGRTYTLSFNYRQLSTNNPDALEIKIGNYAQGDAMTPVPIYSNTNVNSASYKLATANFTVPSTGVYYLGLHSLIAYYSRGLVVDDIKVNEQTPDLLINSPAVGADTVLTSDSIKVRFTVANQGLANAGTHKTYFYLSADDVLTPGANGDTLLDFYDHAAGIVAGTNTGTLTKQLYLPCTTTAGNYKLFIVADGEAVVTEINETNNIATVPVVIEEGALWNGSVNTSWETADNWSCNQVPGPTTNVLIKKGYVIVHASTNIKSLKIKPGVNVTIDPGAAVNIVR